MSDQDSRSDEQRWRDFEKCVNDANEPSQREGWAFIKNALLGNFGTASGKWVKMVLSAAKDGSNCMQHLTPAQREKVIEMLNERQQDKLLTPKPKHL